MLFTDGYVVTLEDLTKLDSEIVDVAATTQPEISIPASIDDTQQEVGAYLMTLGGRISLPWDSGSYGVPYLGVPLLGEARMRPRYSLSQVVTSDPEYKGLWSDLKRYLAYLTLANLYGDASRRLKTADRYAIKHEFYRNEVTEKYTTRMKQAMIPIVIRPMARPGALWEPLAGTWSNASVSLVAGGTAVEDTSYDVAITWIDGTAEANNESAPSDVLTVPVAAGSQVRISIANLVAPNGVFRASAWARYPVQPLLANYWLVYAGVHGSPLTLQVSVPYATKTYDLDVPSTTGAPLGTGQFPQTYIPVFENRVLRA